MKDALILLPDPDAPERVQASDLSLGRWLITDVPCFSSSVAFGDVVSATMTSDGLVLNQVLEESTWSTYGLILQGRDPSRVARGLIALERLGCVVMVRDKVYASVAVPANNFAAAREILETGHGESSWRAGEVLVRESDDAVAAA